MQKRTYQKSWLLNCLFLVVYFIFFAVQLHLRYTAFFSVIVSAPKNHIVLAVQKGQDTKKSNTLHQLKPDVKLNKRYYPTPVYETFALRFKLYQPIVPAKHETFALTTVLSLTSLTCPFLRGPPCTC